MRRISRTRTRRALSALALAIASLTFAIQSCSDRDTEILPTADSGGGDTQAAESSSFDSTTADGRQNQSPDKDSGKTDSPTSGDGAIYLDAGALCTDASLSCAPGFVCCTPCCLAGKEPVCVRGVGDQCPLPDLSVDRTALGQGMYFDTFEAGACELEEQCIGDAGGLRKVLRFDVRIANRGTADLVLGRPEAGAAGFIFAACHEHFHFDDFATYSLKNDAGAVVVAGRKQAFCARDDQRIDPFASPAAKYTCHQQGISVGWQDIYAPELPCQWLDVTDIPPGIYQLEVEVNPSKVMTELDYTNNKASVQVTLP